VVNIRELEIDPRDLLPFSNDAPDGGLIGEGGFGMVFRKTYKGKLVAVKKFKDIEKKGLEPADLAKIHTSFRNEIWLMSGASHPNIVKLLGFSLRRESIMVMEYISGGDLYEALIGDRKLSWPLRYRIALDIARGMAALHALNPPLCHSDLKCPNCMIVDWNAEAAVVAKVSDFGLSSRLYGDQLTKTPTMNPFWTAPEILAELPFDTSADVYSFGVILWNLLSRKALFEEMLPWTDEVSKAVRSGKRPTIPKVPGMLPEYEALIKKCWDHKPAERPKFPQICLDIETMIAKHCPELMPIVEKTRAEMMSATQEFHHDMIRNSMLQSSQGSPSSSLRSPLPASLSSLMLHSHSITNTWNQVPNAAASSSDNGSTSSQQHKARFSIITDTSIAPTYYNNSKLADYGTMLLKQIPAGCVVTLMTTVGLSQVWAYSAAMGLMYVINSVSGQFVKSFVAPKDLECLIEVNFQEGSSEVWAGGAGGLFIWHGETAQPLPHMMSSEHIKSLLYIYKPDRRGVVWAGLTQSSKIQIWSAAIRDLLRTVTLPAEPDTPATEQLTKPASAPTSPNVAVVLSPKGSSPSIVSGGPVVAMVRCGHVVWVACGPFLTQLNANSGAPEGKDVEDSALLEPLLTSSASSSSSSSTDFKPKTSCISAHVGGIKSMVYSRLGKIWTSGADGNMKIWDSTTGALIKTVQNYTPTQLLVVDRTQVWASQPAGTSIDTWNMESCEMVNRVETEHKSPVTRTLLVFNKTVWTAGQDEAIHVFT
jgi:serine/threonine protein kinase